MPTPHGTVTAEIRREGSALRYTLTAPKGMEVIFEGENAEFTLIEADESALLKKS
jgi:hypothetical protein